MSNTFFGSKNLGAKDALAMSWALFPNAADAGVQLLATFPGFQGQAAAGSWLRYVLNPQNNQGAFVFGTAVAMQFQVTQKIPIYDATGSVAVVPGRVVLYVPSTGQVFCLSPNSISDAQFAFLSNPPYKSTNGIVPVSIPTGGTVEVWFEQDYQYIAAVGSYVNATAQVNLTLFNIPLSPVGVN